MVMLYYLESLIRSKGRILLAWSGSTGRLIVSASWSSEKPSHTLSKPRSWRHQKLKILWCRSTREVALSNRSRKCFLALLKRTLHQPRGPNFFSPWWMTPCTSSNSRDKPWWKGRLMNLPNSQPSETWCSSWLVWICTREETTNHLRGGSLTRQLISIKCRAGNSSRSSRYLITWD
jgi:hypothetical protein